MISTWTLDQMEDLKFNMKKIVFDTTTGGTLTLSKQDLLVEH